MNNNLSVQDCVSSPPYYGDTYFFDYYSVDLSKLCQYVIDELLPYSKPLDYF